MNSRSVHYTILITIRHGTRTLLQGMLSGADTFCAWTRVFSKTTVITK